MGSVQLVREMWDALSRGELAPLEEALSPDARWRAVEDGPWNCENRATILEVLERNLASGLSGRIDEAFEVGDTVLVAFRPDHHDPRGWPLDGGVRYVVVAVHGGVITEIKGCADRRAALAFAGARSKGISAP